MSNAELSEGGVDARYFEALADGRFEIPLCASCSKFHFYPRVQCPHCSSVDLRWTAPSGTGVVYSTTVVRRKTGKYNVSLVDLAEGPRLMTRVEGMEPDDVQIGQKVRARIVTHEEAPLLVFVPEESQP